MGSFGNTKGLRLGRSAKWSTIRPIVGKDTVGMYQHMYFYEQIKNLFETNTFIRGGLILSHMEVITGTSEIKVKLYIYMPWLIDYLYIEHTNILRYRSKLERSYGELNRVRILLESESGRSKLLKLWGIESRAGFKNFLGIKKLLRLKSIWGIRQLSRFKYEWGRRKLLGHGNVWERRPTIFQLYREFWRREGTRRVNGGTMHDTPLTCRIKKQMVSLAKYLKIVANNFFVKKVGIILIGLTNETVTADMVCRYLRIKLEQKYTVSELLQFIKRGMRLVEDLRGYQIDFRGRFTRRQRASFERKGVGKMPQSAMVSRIEYAYEQVVLKYGSCGVKVWFYRNGNVAPYGFVATLVA